MVKDLLDSDESSSEDGGADLSLGENFKVNTEFARKFEHNKKREELRRLEDKLGRTSHKRKRHDDEVGNDYNETSSSDSEDEDDAGELITEALDSEIMATLKAIRSKDPRVYDQGVTFYSTPEVGNGDNMRLEKEKPMYLRDYHRENLLNEMKNGKVESEITEPLSYNQEQEALKRSIVDEIHAADDSDEDDGFLVTKADEKPPAAAPPALDVEKAEKDPETFLSNFMNSRAWIPSTGARFQHLESDDEEEDRKAEEFEEAYNFRFEDPTKSNEKLRTHARDMILKQSVRREDANPRKRRRDMEREKKEIEKQELQEEKARLRKLRIEEVEEKVRRIKRAAGLKSGDIQAEDWSRFVDEDWDDTKWESEMHKRFGEEYYADADAGSGSDEEIQSTSRKQRLKKPKWDDDIIINDLVPDFVEEDEVELSDSDVDIPNGIGSTKKKKVKREEARKEAKKERRIIEQLVDDRLEIDTALLNGNSKTKGFRYRDTSPISFGLSAREILLADDTQLNQFAGLKKFAAFRDPDKKRKDRKFLGKKARLRQWRKETFGNEDGIQESELIPAASVESNGLGLDEAGKEDIRQGRRKRRRPKKNQNPVTPVS